MFHTYCIMDLSFTCEFGEREKKKILIKQFFHIQYFFKHLSEAQFSMVPPFGSVESLSQF